MKSSISASTASMPRDPRVASPARAGGTRGGRASAGRCARHARSRRTREDLAARTERNADAWFAIVDGAGNIAYRLALNTLVAGLEGRPELAAALTPGAADGAYLEALAAALEARDGDAASAAAGAILERPLSRL